MTQPQNKISAQSKMKLTGPRLEQMLTLKAAKKFISASVYASAVKSIERAQKRADEAAAAAEAKAIAKEIAAAEAREARRLAGLAKAAATRAAKAAAKAAAVQKFVYTFNVSRQVKQKNADGTFGDDFPMSYEDSVIATPANHNAAIMELVTEWIENLERESDLVLSTKQLVSSPYEIISITPVLNAPTAATAVKMKYAGSLYLDGEEQYDFDTGNGRCVFDWLISFYGSIRGCRKVATLERLTALFGEAALSNGLSCDDLEVFCDAVGCCMYVLDETHKKIKTYTPKKLNNNVPPLAFRTKNQHFYPLPKEAKVIAKMGNGYMTTMAQVADKDRHVAEEIIELVELTEIEGMSRSQQMVQVCRDAGVECFNRKRAPINMNDDGIQSFMLQGRKYFWSQDETVTAAIKICELNGEAYTGQTIPGMLAELKRDLGYAHMSALNPHVSSVMKQCKDRVHYGLVDGFETIPDEAKAYDIAKAYTACIENPEEEFMLFSVTDEFEDWDGELSLGFYLARTDDMRLFHATNLYSSAILKRATRAGIKYEVLRQIRPSKSLPRDYFHPLIAAIRKRCGGDASLAKFFINILVGTLGRTQLTNVYAKMDTCADTVWRDYNSDKEGTPFLMAQDGYYVFGRRVVKELSEHNLPMWLQINDFANIRIFDMIEKSGGILVGRKTDCAVLVGGHLEESGQIGGYRSCEVPTMRPMRPASVREKCSGLCDTPEWETLDITSSSEIDSAWAALTAGAGMMIIGRAGTGKSHMAKALAERFTGAVFKAAFTNKAALNIGGQTIHKMLHVDRNGKFCLNALRQRIGSADSLFIVDEISMIGADLWRLLCEVKKAIPRSKFVLLGDIRQLGPVGYYTNFFESSMVRYLAGGLRAELSVVHRYDSELLTATEAVCAGNLSLDGFQRGAVMSGRHLCRFNATRKRINKELNEHRGLFIAAGEQDGAQDAWIYPGLPIIATRNFSKGGDIYCVNGERFSVVSVGEQIRVMSERPDGEHFWDITAEEFHEFFWLNYCSTVHKAQGETIVGTVTIWDAVAMDARMLYTALTRATKAADVYVA
jgi:hypothetical protein